MNDRSTLISERIGGFRYSLPASLTHILIVGALVVLCGLFLRSTPLSADRSFSLGGTDSSTARRFSLAETTANGRGFRWTTGDSTLALAAQGLGDHTLRLTLSAPWPEQVVGGVPVTVTINDQLSLMVQQDDKARRYILLVPSKEVRAGNNLVRITSPTFQPQEVNNDEQRDLGIVVFDAAWRGLEPQTWLVPTQTALIALAAGLFYTLLLVSGIPFWPRICTLLLFAAITLAMRHSDSRFMYRWHALLVTGVQALIFAALLAAWWRHKAVPTILPVRNWLRAHWPAFVGYVLVTVVMLFPLITHLTSEIIGPPGDNFEYLWKMSWFEQALLGQHVSPVFAPQIFYPTGAELTISEITPAHTLLGIPLTALLGPIPSYNLMIVASFVLSGFGTYLLAHRLGATRGASWVAGLIFAFCLRRYFHANGHFGMMGTEWLPLALYGLEGVLTHRRMWDGFVCGLGLALASWSTLHYGSTLPFLLAVYALVRVGARHLSQLMPSWRPIVVAGAIAFALVLPLAQPYAEAQAEGLTFKHRYEQLLLHTSNLREYVLPNPYHPLWGPWAQQFYRLTDGGEHNFGVGYTALILALVGLWLGRKRRAVQALAVLIVINIVASLGPEWVFADGSRMPLPVKLLADHVPVLSNIRTWSRMAMYVILCLAPLAALALSSVPKRWRNAAVAVAALLVLGESVSMLTLSAPGPRAVDLWLHDQPGMGAVAQVPNGFGGLNEYYTLFTGKPSNHGTGKFPPPAYREGQNLLFGFPRESSVRLLQRWGTDYVIVDEAAMTISNPDWRDGLATQPLLTPVYRDQHYSVYRVQR